MEQWLDSDFHKAIDPAEMRTQMRAFSKFAAVAGRSTVLRSSPVLTMLRALLSEVKQLAPVLGDLKHPSLQQSHKERIHGLLGSYRLFDEPVVLVGTLVEKGVTSKAAEISQVALEAAQEAQLETVLDRIRGVWETKELDTIPYKDLRDVEILTGVDDIFDALDESFVSLNSVLGSRFVGRIRPKVDELATRLHQLQETLSEWVAVQRQWMYLQPVFSGGSMSGGRGRSKIQEELASEARAFQGVDQAYRDIMKKTREDPNALRTVTRS